MTTARAPAASTKEAEATVSKPSRALLRYHLGSAQKILFTKHLAVLLKSGVPLVAALETLAGSQKQSLGNQFIQQVIGNIHNGQSLGAALSQFPRTFDDLYINIVAAGEEAGTLVDNLEFLAAQLSKTQALHKRITGALLYPGIILLALGLIGGLVSFYLLPVVVNVFASSPVDLPASTRWLIWFSHHAGYLFAAIGALILAIMAMVKLPAITPYWHRLLLHLPLLGVMYQHSQLSQYCRNLGLLLKSGLPIVKSATITAGTLSNRHYRRLAQQIVPKLSEGITLSKALSQISNKDFPVMLRELVKVGETSGNLDELLLYSGSYYQRELDASARNLTSVLEPILLIVVGLAVGFVALSMIAPIYTYTATLSGE